MTTNLSFRTDVVKGNSWACGYQVLSDGRGQRRDGFVKLAQTSLRVYLMALAPTLDSTSIKLNPDIPLTRSPVPSLSTSRVLPLLPPYMAFRTMVLVIKPQLLTAYFPATLGQSYSFLVAFTLSLVRSMFQSEVWLSALARVRSEVVAHTSVMLPIQWFWFKSATQRSDR